MFEILKSGRYYTVSDSRWELWSTIKDSRFIVAYAPNPNYRPEVYILDGYATRKDIPTEGSGQTS